MNHEFTNRSGKKVTIDTPNEEVARILEIFYKSNGRLRIWYGDTETGESWKDFYDVTGRISCSNGGNPILILINNARSMGGGSILTNRIIRIDTIDDKRTRYRHPHFHVTYTDEENKAYSQRTKDFLEGKRYNP